MMAGMFLGLLLGLIIGAGGCLVLLYRLHYLVVKEAEVERFKIRSEGLEAANRIVEASREVEHKLYRQLRGSGDQR